MITLKLCNYDKKQTELLRQIIRDGILHTIAQCDPHNPNCSTCSIKYLCEDLTAAEVFLTKRIEGN